MKITQEWTYDASPEDVWAMTVDTGFQDRKCEAAGATSYETSVTEQGQDTVIVATRVMPTDNLPDQLRSLVGKSVDVTETQVWGPADADGSRTATIDVAMKGQPISLKGKASSRVNGGQTELKVDAELKAKIPLIGGRIEKATAPAIIEAIEAEAAAGREWLAG